MLMIVTIIHFKKNYVSRGTFTEVFNTEKKAVAIWKFHNKYNYKYIITDIIHLTKI